MAAYISGGYTKLSLYDRRVVTCTNGCIHCIIFITYHLVLQEGQTVLYWASEAGSMETVKILLEYGAQVNQANNVS